ncbi:putative ATP-dependent dethiobiotin synthetase [Rosellinia necatrix]|uniref:Putative ATP-dependent dethiobiotin synthetase n=1 Tax=Rosellinia necatrix TaxID=77044 RepID=A0A1W2TKM6_ROSNE|nr:putative ATP-dependent dethiobiotin synthetase [Rosellinia necatrix]
MKSQLVLFILATAATAARYGGRTCDEVVLREATSRYIAAQSTGQPQWLTALLSANATLVENNEEIPMSQSAVLHQPLAIAHARSTYDTEACASFSSLVALAPGPGYQIGTQLRLDAGAGGRIARIDSIVTTTGDLYFNATHALHYLLREDWAVLAPADRAPRAALRAAADAYYAYFSDAATAVPWGTPCDRLEGGAYMGQGLANDTCDAGLPPFAVEMRNRRYVIDESVGSVNILSEFGILGPDSHEFRVEKGRIRWIHAMTFCRGTPNCDAPEFPGLNEDVGW